MYNTIIFKLSPKIQWSEWYITLSYLNSAWQSDQNMSLFHIRNGVGMNQEWSGNKLGQSRNKQKQKEWTRTFGNGPGCLGRWWGSVMFRKTPWSTLSHQDYWFQLCPIPLNSAFCSVEMPLPWRGGRCQGTPDSTTDLRFDTLPYIPPHHRHPS